MMLRRIRDFILLLFIVAGVYFGLTWFFFGASHPCEIYYRVRVKPNLEEEMVAHPELTERDKQMLPNMARGRVYELPPAICLWRTITKHDEPQTRKLIESPWDR